jgi:eukaryotic-like serine/threonine-protein kinase
MSLSLPPNSSEPPLGGRYKVISHLGAGGFGQTFLAEDLHLPGHPPCVVKQLKPEISNDHTLQMARRCFNTEAEVLYQLGIHEQIPRLLAHFEEDQEFYLAQEFVEGKSLVQELPEGKVWAEADVVALLKDILSVLSFVHQQQVIHRDIKPSNLIRRQKDNRIELIDFGAVKQVGTPVDPESGLTNVTISIGTKGYMPNEQLAGKPRFSSDVYSVGILGIQALTGVHPRHLEENTEGEIAWHHRSPQVSLGLRQILDRMVSYDFRSRYRDAMEALAAVETLATLPTIAPAPNRAEMPTVLQSVTQLQTPAYAHSGAMERGEEEAPPTAIWLTAGGNSRAEMTYLATQAVGRRRPTATIPTEIHSRRSNGKIWSVVGAIAALGGSYAIAQTFFPHWTAQFLNPNQPSEAVVKPDKSLTAGEQAMEYLKAATQRMQAGYSKDALKLYDQSLALNPASPEANVGRCEALNRLKRPDEAIVSCNDALAYRANYPQALWSKANALFLQGKKTKALGLYEDVTERKPEFAPGWVKRGVTLQALGRSSEALVVLEKGISIYRNSDEAWSTKGQALMTLQRYEEAFVSFNKALQLKPDDPTLVKYRNQAKALQSQ